MQLRLSQPSHGQPDYASSWSTENYDHKETLKLPQKLRSMAAGSRHLQAPAVQSSGRVSGEPAGLVVTGDKPSPVGLLSLPPVSPRAGDIPGSTRGSASAGYLLPLSFVPLKDRGRNSCTFAPNQSVPSKHHTAGFKFLNCGGN